MHRSSTSTGTNFLFVFSNILLLSGILLYQVVNCEQFQNPQDQESSSSRKFILFLPLWAIALIGSGAVVVLVFPTLILSYKYYKHRRHGDHYDDTTTFTNWRLGFKLFSRKNKKDEDTEEADKLLQIVEEEPPSIFIEPNVDESSDLQQSASEGKQTSTDNSKYQAAVKKGDEEKTGVEELATAAKVETLSANPTKVKDSKGDEGDPKNTDNDDDDDDDSIIDEGEICGEDVEEDDSIIDEGEIWEEEEVVEEEEEVIEERRVIRRKVVVEEEIVEEEEEDEEEPVLSSQQAPPPASTPKTVDIAVKHKFTLRELESDDDD